MTDLAATPAWTALAADAAAGIDDLAGLVAREPGRREVFVHDLAGLYVDLSRLAASSDARMQAAGS